MTEISDPNMDTALQWANAIGSPPSLPSSLREVEQRAKLVNFTDSPLIGGSILNKITDEERMRRLDFVTGLGRGFLIDVLNEDVIKNIVLRIWVGCMSAAKEIAPSTKSGLNTPARRAIIFSQRIDLLCQTDPIYESGVEAAPSFKRLRGETFSFEGVPQNSPVRRYGP